MKIYTASRFANQLRLHPIREELTKRGHVVTSRWLDEPEGMGAQEAAEVDLEDVDAADALVLWPDIPNPRPSSFGGLFIEFGYALAKGKYLYVVDDTCNSIFLELPQVHKFSNWELFYTYLSQRAHV